MKSRSCPRVAFTWFVLGLLVASAGAPAYALEVEEVVWGFDGQAVPYRFNQLAVLVSNPSPEPFEGTLRLRRTLTGRTHVGAPLIEPLPLVSPFSQRWVYFYPYVMNDGPWELSWGRRRDEQYEIAAPRHGDPARVMLTDSASLTQRSSALKALPDQLFPTTVAGADTLRLAALDYVPRWDPARTQAFRDWLHSGGVLHIFENAGRFPEFSGELAFLNTPVEMQRVGAGVVHRHQRSLSNLDMDFIETVLNERKPQAGGENAASTAPQQNAYGGGDWSVDHKLFSALKGMTRPDHNWVVIHLMSLAYLALIFPGLYFLGGKRADYRLVFAATLGLAGLFSWAFSVVGRRGYDETTTINSVAIARPLEGGAWDVTGWSNAFVTRGDFYTIEHAGVGRLYSTCQNVEAVNGAIHCGLEGFFRVDIPPYSSRTFGYRARVPGRPLNARLEAAEADAELRSLVVGIDETFPDGAPLIHAVYRNRIYTLQRGEGKLSLAGPGRPVSEFLPQDQLGGFANYAYVDPWSGEYTQNVDEVFAGLGTPLIGRSLDIAQPQQTAAFALPADRVRLLIYAPMPDEFFINSPELGQQAGYVLYSIDLPIEGPEEQ